MFKKTKVRDLLELLGRNNVAEVQAIVLEVRQVMGGYFRVERRQTL